MESMETQTSDLADKSQGKRLVQRRCPVCDRGHSCFATAADLDAKIMESPQEISLGSTHRLSQDVVGAWHGVKTRIPEGTKVIVKNLMTEKTPAGGLRAMIELPDGDTQWISAALLGHTVS